jgi:hypothetical protein
VAWFDLDDFLEIAFWDSFAFDKKHVFWNFLLQISDYLYANKIISANGVADSRDYNFTRSSEPGFQFSSDVISGFWQINPYNKGRKVGEFIFGSSGQLVFGC